MLRCQSRKQEWHQIPLDTFDLLHQRNCVGHFSLFLNHSASKLLNLSLTSALSFSIRSSFIEAALNVHCQVGKKKNTVKRLILKKQRVVSDRDSAHTITQEQPFLHHCPVEWDLLSEIRRWIPSVRSLHSRKTIVDCARLSTGHYGLQAAASNQAPGTVCCWFKAYCTLCSSRGKWATPLQKKQHGPDCQHRHILMRTQSCWSPVLQAVPMSVLLA